MLGHKNIYVRFLVQVKIVKSPFEINWSLVNKYYLPKNKGHNSKSRNNEQNLYDAS